VLRTVFQIIRSGQFGRTCLSASLQRPFQRWLNKASAGMLLSASIGQQPSLRDVLRLARPTPKDHMRRALFGWLTDKEGPQKALRRRRRGKEASQWVPATAADLPEQVWALTAYVMTEWQQFVTHQLRLGGRDTASPKLVCINLQPYGTTQAPDRADILNIGGFSDAVFQVIATFLGEDPSRFVAEVESITL
jgi:hypothetical protein